MPHVVALQVIVHVTCHAALVHEQCRHVIAGLHEMTGSDHILLDVSWKTHICYWGWNGGISLSVALVACKLGGRGLAYLEALHILRSLAAGVAIRFTDPRMTVWWEHACLERPQRLQLELQRSSLVTVERPSLTLAMCRGNPATLF